MRRFLFIGLLLAASAPVAAQTRVPSSILPKPTLPGDSSRTVLAPFAQLPALSLMKGESLFVTFSVHSDTIVRVSGTTVVPRSCGFSYLIARFWLRQANTVKRDSALVGVAWAQLQSLLTVRGSAGTVPPDSVICAP